MPLEDTQVNTAPRPDAPSSAKPAKRRVPHRLRVDSEREEMFMERMQTKLNFTTNPRYTKKVEEAATMEGHATSVGVETNGSPIPFGVSPAVVEFTNYTVLVARRVQYSSSV